jgi:hypothetical protein
VPFKPAPIAAVKRESTVLVDVKRLEDAWAATQEAPGYIGSGGRGGFQREYEKFTRKLLEARATQKAIVIPQVALDEDGQIDFRDGEEAFAVFRDQNALVLPITVPRDQAVEFRKQFGATAELLRAVAGFLRWMVG